MGEGKRKGERGRVRKRKGGGYRQADKETQRYLQTDRQRTNDVKYI